MNHIASARPPVGVVIVNHNLKDSLRETLESFQQVNYPNLTIVVSDNASTDGSPDMVRRLFPQVHLLTHETQQGYARAASLGMKFLVDKTDYIFSTTNDVIIDPEMINELVNYAEAHPEAGVLGTKIYFHDKPDVIWHAGARVHPLHGHSYTFGWLRRDHERYSKVRDCDFVGGCGFLLRCEVLRRIGFYKEDMIFYSEDADLCYRIRESGSRVVYVPTAKMWHKVGTTLAKNRPVQLYYSTRNGLYLLQRHRIGLHPLTLLIHIFVVSPAKMLFFALCWRWANCRGIYRGIRDWRKGRYGWITQ